MEKFKTEVTDKDEFESRDGSVVKAFFEIFGQLGFSYRAPHRKHFHQLVEQKLKPSIENSMSEIEPVPTREK